MKKISTLILFTTLLMISCKKEDKKKDEPVNQQTENNQLRIITDSTKVGWTAYKTTEKTPVKGIFKEISLNHTNSGESPEEILEGATFSIPVSSIFTENPDRDNKLKTFFFGTLKNTELIGGTFNFKDQKCLLTLTLNDVSKQLEVPYTYNNKIFSIESTINLEDFNALNAIEAINKACFELHKGIDGISKTWNEVAISGSIQFE